jgi:hypothetical protein
VAAGKGIGNGTFPACQSRFELRSYGHEVSVDPKVSGELPEFDLI